VFQHYTQDDNGGYDDSAAIVSSLFTESNNTGRVEQSMTAEHAAQMTKSSDDQISYVSPAIAISNSPIIESNG
jgi:hypothetical protein